MNDARSREWRIRLFIVLGCCVLCILVSEEMLRWWDIADPPVFDTSTLYGYLMRPNQSVSTRGYRFHINQAGLRGPDFVMPKQFGIYRIAFLGDSITYGGGPIRDSDLFVNRVASNLASFKGQRIEALNISAPGWGIQNVAAYISTNGVLDSDLVVWVVPSVDFRRRKTSAAENGFVTEKPKSRLWYVLKVGLRNLWLLFPIRGRKSSEDVEGLADGGQILEQNVRVFRGTLAELTGRGIPVAVVFVPKVSGYGPPNDLAEYRSAAASCSVPFVDGISILVGQDPEKLFIDGIHLSRGGHALMAEEITNFLERDFLGVDSEKRPREGCQVVR